MVDNGYISFGLVETGGGQDVSGNPTASTISFSANIGCNIRQVTNDYQIYSEGQYRQAQFIATVDKKKLRALTTLNLNILKEVVLIDGKGAVLGTYQVRAVQWLKIVQTVKIVC